jgi:Spy/CpxP family protein refolding chaperone
MMLHLTSRISSAIAAATMLGAVTFVLPTAAMAQTPAAPVAVSAAKATRANPVEARIRSLHAALKITAAQEPQWQAVADVMRDNAKTTGALIQKREANAKTMTAIEDLHSYGAIADAHAAGVSKLTVAFETLYDSLSDGQKQAADAAFRRPPAQPKKSG